MNKLALLTKLKVLKIGNHVYLQNNPQNRLFPFFLLPNKIHLVKQSHKIIKVMEIQLLDLPQVCLEEIFKNLPYAEISRMGAVCKYFREISKTIFRLYFKRQEKVIECEMVKIESETAKLDKLTVDDHLHMALLHSVCWKKKIHPFS